MNKENAVKYAYAAGFMDGEGSIHISRRFFKNGKSPDYHLLVTISQKDGAVMDWLYGNFGGCVVMKNKNSDGTDWIHEWRADNNAAADFLKKVLPFLRYKRPQAELALRFQQRKSTNGMDPKGRFQRITEHELQVREEMRVEMKRLKHIFQKSKNPNVKEYNFPSMVQS